MFYNGILMEIGISVMFLLFFFCRVNISVVIIIVFLILFNRTVI